MSEDRKIPPRRPPAGTEARYEFDCLVLGPEIVNFLTAIQNYQPGTYPEELLRTSSNMLSAAPGLVALAMNEDSRRDAAKIIDAPISGETFGDVAHALRKWAATFKTDAQRIH